MQVARVWSFLAWHWMAISFWLGIMAGVFFAWNHLVQWRAQSHGVRTQETRLALDHRRSMSVIGGILLFLFCWGFVEAQMIRLKRVVLKAPAGSALRKSLRIVLISDVHLSLIRGDRLARKVAALIEAAKPDVLLSSGDFLDGQAKDLEDSAAILAPVTPPLGKFGVLGNHEWYSGLDEAEKTYKAAGIRLLRGEQVYLRDDVVVAGSDDPTGKRSPSLYHDADAVPFFKEIAGQGRRRAYIIYLHHQPRVPSVAIGKFDLMLSGHTHGGQIFPFGWAVRLFFKYIRGMYDLPAEEGHRGAKIYVSPGTGTWGPSLRVLARPEVTLIEILPTN